MNSFKQFCEAVYIKKFTLRYTGHITGLLQSRTLKGTPLSGLYNFQITEEETGKKYRTREHAREDIAEFIVNHHIDHPRLIAFSLDSRKVLAMTPTEIHTQYRKNPRLVYSTKTGLILPPRT